jgi:hypothetical protein
LKRRNLLRMAVTLPLLSGGFTTWGSPTENTKAILARTRQRVRPGDLGWPSSAAWDRFNQKVGGRLLKLTSPFADCDGTSGGTACREALDHIKNPYFIGDQPALTQASGWVDAWTSRPSSYAVAAVSTADIVAAVNFARTNNLRLVVKGGGHGYQGVSNAPDSLLIWTLGHHSSVGFGRGRNTPSPENGCCWPCRHSASGTRST